jgi:predicted enzyme related to lactoylglutathione lyase
MLNDAVVYSVLPAKDINRLRTFLSEKLGLEPSSEMTGMYMYDIAGCKLLAYESPFAGTNQATAVSFDVPDLEMVVADLKDKGVMFEHYDMPGGTLEGDIHMMEGSPMKSAWFKDTEGNILNVNQSE